MEAQVYTAFAEKRRSAGIPGIVHSDQKPQDKLKLSLRRTPFTLELSKMKLPSEVKDLLAELFRQREKGLSYKYESVFVFNKLKTCGSFWLDYKFNSLDDFLSHYDLPNGKTLGMWELLVSLFEKETFLLIGDEALSYMTLQVSIYQDNSDERKKDYSTIFRDYCSQYSVYDKVNFYRVVNFHVHRRYVVPTAKPHEDIDVHKRAKKIEPVGVVRVRRIGKASSGQTITPHLQRDFVTVNVQCGGCKQRDATISAQEKEKQDAATYILALEQIVIEKLGNSALPKKGRPKFVENYEK